MITTLILATAIQVFPRTHSHNDYLRKRPLFEALENGFASVEADLFLVEGKLLVAHGRNQLKPENTLESMYLRPLSEIIRKNKGSVYPGYHHPLWVLIDIKEGGSEVYKALKSEAARHPELSYHGANSAIRFVISGDRPIEDLVKDKGRFAGLDGRLDDLDKGFTPEFMPWVSGDWSDSFRWNITTPFTEMDKLKGISDHVHKGGYLLRFWGAADDPAVWETQWKGGVDLLNADHLSVLRTWMSPFVNKD